MYIVSGTASESIAEDLSEIIDVPLAKREYRVFPDGELYVRIVDDISNEQVIIVQTTYPNENIVELLLLQDALKENGASEVSVVVPYFGYARQDQKFEEGEPISARVMAEHISLKADRAVTVDPHKEYITDFFSVPAFSCSAVSQLAEYFKNEGIDMVLAPDKGAVSRARKASSVIGCDFDYLEKHRVNGKTVEMKPKKLDAKNRNVVIVDDIISTGGTMSKAIKQLKNSEANKIFVACTHGLFADNAAKKLSSAGCDKIISTDTIENKYSKVKVAPCIADILFSKNIV